MFGSVFTLDYEIHGTGTGSPLKLMVEPTYDMLELFEKYGARLTIMADVGEILKFREYYQEHGKDKFFIQAIEKQLKEAVQAGHDVQLHIHSSYFKSKCVNDSWQQCWEEYSLADLPYDRVHEMIGSCKDYLENLLKEVVPAYECTAFRAANWSMSPSKNIIKALVQQGITIDTSVFKYGKRNDRVKFDYSNAHSDLVPWTADPLDVCKFNPSGQLMEIPIYTEQKGIFTFLTPNRLFRVFQASMNRHPKYEDTGEPAAAIDPPVKTSKIDKALALFREKHAWKFDFNQCTGKQLITGLKRINKKYGHLNLNLPVVLIGHSKIYNKVNEKSLEPYLKFVRDHPDNYFFASFGDFDLQSFKEVTV